jgi:hypothetical protein
MIESRGREQEDKSQDTLQQVLLAIKYEKDPDMDGNTLYPIESSKEPLPRYIKTPKEPILPKETHHTPALWLNSWALSSLFATFWRFL